MRANAVVVSEETHLQGLWKWISCILYTQRHGPVVTLTVLTVPLQSFCSPSTVPHSPSTVLHSPSTVPHSPSTATAFSLLNIRSVGVDVSLAVLALMMLDQWSGLWVLMFHWQ